jgi:hypothetical protein
MQELVTEISSKTGLDTDRAERALGIVLGLVKNQGNPAKIKELLAKLPGAEELAAKHGGDGAARGGLMGMLGGGLMGGPLAAISKLTAAGLSMEQIKQTGTLTLEYAKKNAGAELVREVAGSIPGLSGYV